MATQNISVMVRMKRYLIICALFATLQVSAVRILIDEYLASSTPQKLNLNEDREALSRVRRDAEGAGIPGAGALSFTDVYLNGTEKHKEAFMHWSGKKSNVIYILTRQRGLSGEVLDSKLWQSKDYGTSYKNITGKFGTDVRITFFYVSPADKNRLIFVDVSNKRLYITMNELQDIKVVNVTFTPDRLLPHPTDPDYVLAYSMEQRQLFSSNDYGKTWTDFHEGVTARVFWGNSKYEKNNDVVHLEIQSSNGEARYKKCRISQDCRKQDFVRSAGTFDSFSMLVVKEYVFVQKTSTFESIMYVSYKGQDFRRAYFPPTTNTKDFLIVNANEGQVFIAVNHLTTSNLYLSDPTGQFYVLTLPNTVFLQQPQWFDVEIYEVAGIKGVYIANQNVGGKLQTLISFDKGGNWNSLPPPTTTEKCTGANCSLHLDVRGLFGPGIVSEANAPGILVAHGNIGNHLTLGQKTRSIFVSRNGGWQWDETSLPPSRYRFNILDQGSVLIAIDDAFIKSTNTVYYSVDEGKTWNGTLFLSDKAIAVDGVLNEPNITTLVASVYGHQSHGSVWTVVKLNFSTVLPNKCDKTADYEQWTPSDQSSKTKCILGNKFIYERRKQLSRCYNGEDYERAINITACLCDEEDFECDYGYEKGKTEHECTKSSWFSESTIFNECPEGKFFNQSQGYRKVGSDQCYGGVSDQDKYKPTNKTCPTIQPGELGITINQPIAATNSDVVFTLTQGKGSKISTMYTWTFNDSSPAKTVKGLENSQVTHQFKTFGTYNVQVEAKNEKGSTKKSIQIRVEDKITNSIVSIPWAVKVGHETDFDIDVYGPLVSNNQAHIHFLWTFGDEVGSLRPMLSWERRVQHTYNKTGNYTVTVEAINSVSTVYKQYTVQAFDSGTILRLSFSPNAERFHFDQKIFTKIMFLQLLKQILYLSYGLSANRLEVHLHSTSPVMADVLLLPSKNSDDVTVEDLVALIKKAVSSQTLRVQMDGRADRGHVILVTGAQVVNDSSTPQPAESHGPNLHAVYIAIPVLLCAGIVTLLVLVYYRRRFRESRRYSILRQRSDSDALLGADDEDDPPLDLNPDFGTSDRMDDDQLDLGTA